MGDEAICSEIVNQVRSVMRHCTGTNCMFVDDDVRALGILAGIAVASGAYAEAAIPTSMKDAISAYVLRSENA